MEVTEIVSYFLNDDANTLEVSFRTTLDSEDEVRNDTISLKEAKDFGYNLLTESFDFFDEDDEFEDEDEMIDIDEDELMGFLNEYYTVNAKRLPKSDFF